MNKFGMPGIGDAPADRKDMPTTRQNPVPLAMRLMWMLSAAFVLFLMWLDYAKSEGILIGRSEVWPRDFVNLWAGGKLIAARDFVSLYTPDAFRAFEVKIFGPIGPHIYSYPPTAFPLASLFSLLPYVLSALLWLATTGLFFACAAKPWWPRAGGWSWLVLITPAALINIWTGHYAFLLGGLFLIAWRLVDTRPLAAGIAIGLLAIKPQFAILIPLALLIRGNWRVIWAAAATVVAMVVGTVLVYGAASWTEFFGRATGKQVSVIDAHGAFFGKMSASAATAILDMGGSWPLALVGQSAMALLGIGLVAFAAWRRVRTDRLALLLATCTFLVLPYSINYDLVIACLGAWVVMVDATNAPLDRGLATVGFAAPAFGIILATYGAPVTPLMLAALAIAQFRVAVGFSGRAVPAGAGAAHSA